jgi:hypothetical protein
MNGGTSDFEVSYIPRCDIIKAFSDWIDELILSGRPDLNR